jgi:hypothetical protein
MFELIDGLVMDKPNVSIDERMEIACRDRLFEGDHQLSSTLINRPIALYRRP